MSELPYEVLDGIGFHVDKHYNLVLTATAEAGQALQKMHNEQEYGTLVRTVRESLLKKNGPYLLEFTVGLTGSPQFASKVDWRGRPLGHLWWFPSYEVEDEWAALIGGQVVFRYGTTIRPLTSRNALLLEVREQLDMHHGEDWDGAMVAWFDICAELEHREVVMPKEWGYKPPAVVGDKREHDSATFEACANASTVQLHYAGRVLERYVRMIEKVRERRKQA